MSSITKISCRTVPRLLKEPFRTSLRTVSHFDVIEFHIETDEGLRAIGGAVETPAITGDTQEKILNGLLGQISEAIEGIAFSSPLELADKIAETSVVSSAKAAADMSLYFLEAEMQGKSLSELLGSTRTSVATDVTIPVADITEIERLVLARRRGGFNGLKVKFAMEPVESSIEKLELIDRIVGRGCVMRIDPNQAWTVAHTLHFLDEIEKVGIQIDYLEQPTPAHNKQALAEISRNTRTPLMADESCFDMDDLLEIIELGAADLVNLKLLKSGGITPTLKMAEVARRSGLDVRVGSMMEGDVGVFASACVASALAPMEIHDLDASWWAKDSKIKYESGEVLLR